MYIQIGKKIREYRTKRGLTQEQLAEHLNVSFQSISKWERGEATPDVEKLVLLTQFLEISADELLGLKDEVDEDGIDERWS